MPLHSPLLLPACRPDNRTCWCTLNYYHPQAPPPVHQPRPLRNVPLHTWRNYSLSLPSTFPSPRYISSESISYTTRNRSNSCPPPSHILHTGIFASYDLHICRHMTLHNLSFPYIYPEPFTLQTLFPNANPLHQYLPSYGTKTHLETCL